MTSKNAFTLVEILVITTIVVLFSGTLLASYNNFNQQKNLEKEISRLIDVLSLAKSKTQAADLDPSVDCSGSDEFGGYQVDINDSSYSFKQCCRDAVSKSTSFCGSDIQVYDFQSGIINESGASTLNFYPLAEGATPLLLTIKSTSINKCYEVNISETAIFTTSDIISC